MVNRPVHPDGIASVAGYSPTLTQTGGPVSLRELAGPIYNIEVARMTVQLIARFLARCESLLFPRNALETRTVDTAVGAVTDPLVAVLEGRELPDRGEPFTGFASPPGRF